MFHVLLIKNIDPLTVSSKKRILGGEAKCHFSRRYFSDIPIYNMSCVKS